MDLKRNYSTIQPPSSIKTTPLLNPLLTISNASTPVRTRIVKPGSQLNSTPVNVHKIGMHIRSPVLACNKENDQGNKMGVRGKEQQPGNLSPILALNRKGADSARAQTPTGFKREAVDVGRGEGARGDGGRGDGGRGDGGRGEWGARNQQHGQNLQESRNSNSFRSMLDSRSKTPTRTAFAQTLQRQNSQPNNILLRTSNSANSLLQGMGKLRQSRNNKIVQSRSFQQIANLGTPVVKGNEVLCSNSNEHEKKVKAKYKVVEEPDDDELLVYCSKCAINLVQKGFKVEDLTTEDINRIRQMQQNMPHEMQRSSNEYYDYAEQTNRKLEIKLNELAYQKQNLITAYQKQIDDVDCYYNSIITLVQEQKNRDREVMLRNLDREKKSGEHLHKRLLDASGQMGYLLRNGVGQAELNLIQGIECLLAEKGFGCRFDGSKCLADNIQYKFEHFSRFFESEGRLRIESEDKEEEQLHGNFNNRFHSRKQSKQECPLRFSFQKHIKQSKKSPFALRKNMMNPLEEAPESMEGEDSRELAEDCSKKPFRTLFPEDEEESSKQEAEEKQAIHSPTFKQI